MKKAAVVSLICSSIALIVLCAIFFVLLTNNGTSNTIGGFFNMEHYEFSDYQTGNASLPAETLDEIEVDWVSGSVDIEIHDQNTIEIREEYTGNDDSQKLRYRYENGKLSVKFCKPQWFFGIFHRFEGKNLTLLIPANLADHLQKVKIDNVSAAVSVCGLSGNTLDMETVSGNIRATDLHFKKIDIDGVSADVFLSGITAEELDQETVSGGFTMEGTAKTVKADSVSGRLEFTFHEPVAKFRSETVSGDTVLYLPEESEFHLKYEKVSGNFRCDFPGLSGDDEFTVGNGDGNFRLETVSGKMEVLKK